MGDTFCMAALREALQAQAKGKSKPPRLRVASRPARSCSSCTYFKAKALNGSGACRLYGGFPVKAGQVSDAWKAP